MQITIVQAEIETAIRQYILSQINIREGMDIAIKLAATRGAEGFSATIDIASSIQTTANVVPFVQATPEKVASPIPGVPAALLCAQTAQLQGETQVQIHNLPSASIFSTAKVPQTPAEVRQVMEAQYGAEAATAEEVVTTKVEALISSEQAENRVDPVSTTTTDEPVADTTAPKPSSLFKNLRKPVNA